MFFRSLGFEIRFLVQPRTEQREVLPLLFSSQKEGKLKFLISKENINSSSTVSWFQLSGSSSPLPAAGRRSEQCRIVVNFGKMQQTWFWLGLVVTSVHSHLKTSQKLVKSKQASQCHP
ncbi:hypothetical protein Droror1_Dr00024906 [Drosera rotundifolia]